MKIGDAANWYIDTILLAPNAPFILTIAVPLVIVVSTFMLFVDFADEKNK